MTQPLVQLTLKCDGDKYCRHPATHIAHIHKINHCNHPNLTPYGDTALLLCHQCLCAAIQLATRDIRRRNKRLPNGACVCCRTCGRPISSINDVLEIEEI